MDLPVSLLSEIIKVGKIIFLDGNHLHGSDLPHPHFIIYAETDVVLLVGTSQFDKASRRIELRKQDFQTLVTIKAQPQNQLTKDTYIDCNSYKEMKISVFFKTITPEKIKGSLTASELQQILQGFEASKEHPDIVKEKIITALQNSIENQ